MSRYIKSSFKKSRRYGFSILENGKEFAKGRGRQYAPGQHGQKRVKVSEYGLHLYEKQKLRYMYGISEKQFKNTFEKASKKQGQAGINFMQMLETRLDSFVYRTGLAETRRQARQLVNHGHFTLNDKKADIPSMQIKVGDIVTLKEKSRKNIQVLDSQKRKEVAPWVKVNKEFSFKLERLPERKELNTDINESLIVEHYNK